MTKEITKAYILQQIQDKFKLREFEPEIFTFQESVIPTYEISPHLMEYTARFSQTSVTGIGGILLYTVPQHQRMHLNAYNVIFMGAGAYTVAGVYIKRKKEVYIDSFVYLDLKANQNVSYAINLPKTVTLDSGDALNINVDSYTSTQDLRLYMDYMLEDIR